MKPLRIQYTKDSGTYLKGAEFAYHGTPAQLEKDHPDARILRFEDGEPFEARKAPPEKRSEKSDATDDKV